MSMSFHKILCLCILVAVWDGNLGVEALPQGATERNVECSTSNLKTVYIAPGETEDLISVDTSASRCGFKLTTARRTKIYVKCDEVNLPSDYEIRLWNNVDDDTFQSSFTYEASKHVLKMRLFTQNQVANINEAFSCVAAADTSNPFSETTDSVTDATTVSSTGCQCGVRNSNRIVGGQNADEFEYPWIVSLGDTFCGGTLVTPTKIITAAHCVSNRAITVYLGQYNREVDHSYTLQRTVSIRNIQAHPQYNSRTLDYDIAVLTLSEPVPFSDKISPICLPETNSDYVGDTVTAIGWGTRSAGGSQPNILQEVDLEVTSKSVCQAAYGVSDITDRMMCAAVDGGGKDSCQGDSGGPLMYKDPTSNAYELVGVVSWGIGCAEAEYPGVYSRVTELRSWVLNEIGGENELCDRP